MFQISTGVVCTAAVLVLTPSCALIDWMRYCCVSFRFIASEWAWGKGRAVDRGVVGARTEFSALSPLVRLQELHHCLWYEYANWARTHCCKQIIYKNLCASYCFSVWKDCNFMILLVSSSTYVSFLLYCRNYNILPLPYIIYCATSWLLSCLYRWKASISCFENENYTVMLIWVFEFFLCSSTYF